MGRDANSPTHVDLRHLRAFVEVARNGSVSRAGGVVGLTQSRVSQLLKELETSLNTALFTRIGKRLSLTPAGRLFLDHSVEVLDKLELGVRAVMDPSDGERGHLRVGVVPACNSMFMPAILGQLHTRQPGYTVSVEERSANDLERELEAGRLDVGLGFLPHASPSLLYRRLLREKFALIVGREHALAARTLLQMSDLHELEMVLLPGRYYMRQLIDQFLARHRVRPRIHFEMDSLSAIIRTVQESGLATLLPPFVVPPAEAPNLKALALDGRQPLVEVGLMQPAGTGRNAPVLRFVEVAADVVSRRSGQLVGAQ
jgi:LysR family cyn operon transcriptional activator